MRDAYGRWLRLRGHVDASDLMQLYEAGNSDAQMEYVHTPSIYTHGYQMEDRLMESCMGVCVAETSARTHVTYTLDIYK